MGHEVAYFSTLLGILFGLLFDLLGLPIKLHFLGAVLVTHPFQFFAFIGNRSIFVLKLSQLGLELVFFCHDFGEGLPNLFQLVPQLFLLFFSVQSELVMRLLSGFLLDFQTFESLPVRLLFPLYLSLHLRAVCLEPLGVHFAVDALVSDVVDFLQMGHLHSLHLLFDLCLLVLVGVGRFGGSLFYFFEVALDFGSLLCNGLAALFNAPTPLFQILGSACYLSFPPLELTLAGCPDFGELRGDSPVRGSDLLCQSADALSLFQLFSEAFLLIEEQSTLIVEVLLILHFSVLQVDLIELFELVFLLLQCLVLLILELGLLILVLAFLELVPLLKGFDCLSVLSSHFLKLLVESRFHLLDLGAFLFDVPLEAALLVQWPGVLLRCLLKSTSEWYGGLIRCGSVGQVGLHRRSTSRCAWQSRSKASFV